MILCSQWTISTCLWGMEKESRSIDQVLVFSGLMIMQTMDEQWLFPLTSPISL